ncbi:helix-turn-helix protein [Microcystis phage Mae-JY09]
MTGTHELGPRIRAARIAAGLTQEQLAERAGITDRTVRAIEAGTTTPQRRIREGLAQVLGDVSDLHESEPATAGTAQTS